MAGIIDAAIAIEVRIWNCDFIATRLAKQKRCQPVIQSAVRCRESRRSVNRIDPLSLGQPCKKDGLPMQIHRKLNRTPSTYFRCMHEPFRTNRHALNSSFQKTHHSDKPPKAETSAFFLHLEARLVRTAIAEKYQMGPDSPVVDLPFRLSFSENQEADSTAPAALHFSALALWWFTLD